MLKKLVHVQDDAARGGEQPDQGSLADACMHVATRYVVALAEAYSPARFQRRPGAFVLSAGVAMDLRLGWDLGLEADHVKAQEWLRVEKPHLLTLSTMCLALSQLQATQHKAKQNGGAAEAGQASLGVCLKFDTTAGRAMWTGSL